MASSLAEKKKKNEFSLVLGKYKAERTKTSPTNLLRSLWHSKLRKASKRILPAAQQQAKNPENN